MTTGTLKFASLLMVIITGGGVAWQAQQGILKQSKVSKDAVDENAADEEDDVDLAIDLTDSSPTPIELPPDKPTAADWNDDGEMPPLQLAAAPKKYQRTTKTASAQSAAVPIPARKTAKDSDNGSRRPEPAKSDDAEDMGDPFAEESPKKSPRRPKLTPIPEDVPVEDDEDHAAIATAAGEEDTDNASPVLTVGHEELQQSHGKKPPKSQPKPTAAEESLDIDDDPFADSAPPALDAETKSDEEAADAIEMPGEPEDNDNDAFPSLEVTDETPPPRTRRKAVEPIEDGNADFGAAPLELDAEPKIDLPGEGEEQAEKTDEAMEDFGGNPSPEETAAPTEADPFGDSDPNRNMSPESAPDEAVPVPSRSKPKKRPSEEKQPGLLPVPDLSTKDDEPGLPLDEPGNAPADSSAMPRRTFQEDPPVGDLDGDAVPDASAPRGVQQPRLTIEKIAPKQATLRQPLVYSVLVKNTGSADAHHVTVEDRIPKGTTLVGTSPQAELIDKRLVWKLGTLRPDEHRKISIKVIPEQQGQIGSVAKVNFVAEVAADIEVTAPQLVLNIESPSQVRLGDKLHMIFKVRNTGGADAANVVIRNLIPDGLRHPAGADLEYAMGTLAAQETQEIKLDLIATKNGKVVNKTIITGEHGIKVEEETPIEVIGEQLLLTRTGKSKVFVDKQAVFTSTVANEGTAPASRVNVAEVVPAGFEFVSASNNGQFDPATRAVTWTLGPIGPGEEMQLSTQLLPKKTGEYRSTITVTGPAGSVATVDAELKVEGHAAVGLDSKMDKRLISIGEKAIVRIHCKNQGTALARNIILSAELPPELKLVNGKGQTEWNHQGHTVAFDPIPALQPNETASFELQVEGVAEGDTVIELKFAADHLKRPLQRDETIRVASGGE